MSENPANASDLAIRRARFVVKSNGLDPEQVDKTLWTALVFAYEHLESQNETIRRAEEELEKVNNDIGMLLDKLKAKKA